MLPVRVGDGDVPGIFFNTIVPDLRQLSPAEAAALVVDRLGLVDAGPVDQLPASLASGHRTHRVQPGDALDQLAARYLGSPAEWRQIATLNGLLDPLALRPGRLLAIPHPVATDA